MFLFQSCILPSLALLMSLTVTTASQAAAATPRTATVIKTKTRPLTWAVRSTGRLCAGQPTGFYADPYSCNYYYLCTTIGAYKEQCPVGLHFNTNIKKCDSPKNAECKFVPRLTNLTNKSSKLATSDSTSTDASPVTSYTLKTLTNPTTSTTISSYSTPTGASPVIISILKISTNPIVSLEFCVGKPLGLYPDPYSCNYYYLCTPFRIYKEQCPVGFYYNPKLRDCDSPNNVECNTVSKQTTSAKSASTTAPSNSTSTDDSPVTASILTSPTNPSASSSASSISNSTRISPVTSPISKITTSRIASTAASNASISPVTSSILTTPTNSTASTTAPSISTSTGASPGAASILTNPTYPTASIGFCVGKPIDFYPDPYSCYYYYLCFKLGTYKEQCPVGLYFNPKIKACDLPYNVECNAVLKLTASAKIASTTTSSNSTSSGALSVTSYISKALTHSSDSPKTSSISTSMRIPLVTSSIATSPTTHIMTTTSLDKINKCQRIVCYFGNWAQYRLGVGKFTVEDVDYTLCTHIIYAYAKLKGNRLAAKKKGEESTKSKEGSYEKLIKYKKSNPQLKVLLALDGYYMGPKRFSRTIATKRDRKEFIDSSIKFLRTRGFDGLDLDWQYPTLRENSYHRNRRFVLLCQELKAAFKKEAIATGKSPLLLTLAVGSDKDDIEKAYIVPPINKAVDFMNILTYDFYNIWVSNTARRRPQGSLETELDTYYNVWSSVDIWLKHGVSKYKLVVGIAFFAKSTSNTKVAASSYSAGIKGKYTREREIISYYETCIMKKKRAKRHLFTLKRVPYLVKGKQWIGHDDLFGLKEKCGFVKERGLGGVIVRDLALDDFKGLFCGEGKFPLMNAINKECYV